MAKDPRPPDDGGYTLDPDRYESDRVVGRPSIYQEEAGLKPAPSTPAVVIPCPACGLRVLQGKLRSGTVLAVDLDVPMYTVVWQAKEPLPTFLESRGYAAHACLKED